MKMPDMPTGVANPYVVHVHPYPTRYHGSVYTRPEFGLPYVVRPQGVLRPANFSRSWPQAPITPPLAGANVDTGEGSFRRPSSGGGGVFNASLAGRLGQTDAAKLAAFFGAVVVAGIGTYYGIQWMRRK